MTPTGVSKRAADLSRGKLLFASEREGKLFHPTYSPPLEEGQKLQSLLPPDGFVGHLLGRAWRAFPQHGYHSSLHLNLVGVSVDRSHASVRRLEADAPRLTVQPSFPLRKKTKSTPIFKIHGSGVPILTRQDTRQCRPSNCRKPTLIIIGAVARWSGWVSDLAYVHKPTLVIRPKGPFVGGIQKLD